MLECSESDKEKKMGLKSGAAAQGKKTHNDKATSKMSKTQYITKPENRHGMKHNYSVSQAESMVRKFHG